MFPLPPALHIIYHAMAFTGDYAKLFSKSRRRWKRPSLRATTSTATLSVLGEAVSVVLWDQTSVIG